MFWRFRLLFLVSLVSLLSLLSLLMGGCALLSPPSQSSFQGPRETVFYAKFDHVWRAVGLTLQKYPLQSSDVDKGLLETGPIKGNEAWVSPHEEKKERGGLSYRLRVQVTEGHIKGYLATKVSIDKEITLKRDFFSGEETIPSDGLEELALLYRIGRELQIDKALEKIQKQSFKKKSS